MPFADEPFDPQTFLCTFPVWVLSHAMELRASAILRACSDSGRLAAPIFTDKAALDEFVDRESSFPDGHVDFPLDPLAFLGLLTLLEKHGFTQILIDPTRRNHRPYPLIDMKAHVLKWLA